MENQKTNSELLFSELTALFGGGAGSGTCSAGSGNCSSGSSTGTSAAAAWANAACAAYPVGCTCGPIISGWTSSGSGAGSANGGRPSGA